jgi:hypothetical protein
MPALLLSSGCSLFGPTGCDTYASALITVSVFDSRTLKPIVSPLVVAFFSVAQGDSIVRPLPEGAPQAVAIRYGELSGWGSGEYAVEVRGEGFKVWRRDRVLVEGDCHPHRRVTAYIVPQ